jgi:hypothetical protein
LIEAEFLSRQSGNVTRSHRRTESELIESVIGDVDLVCKTQSDFDTLPYTYVSQFHSHQISAAITDLSIGDSSSFVSVFIVFFLCFFLSLYDTFNTVIIKLHLEINDCCLRIDWKDVLNVEDVVTEILIMLCELQKCHAVG